MSEPAIRTLDLTKRFGSLVALDHLTLDVEQGEVFGFLGPNGAGKSTTLRLLLGFIRATSGSATVMGIDTRDVETCHRHLAYVPGDVSLWPKLTGEECLELLGNLHGDVDTGYRAELVERFSLELDKRSRTYSKGNRQKVALVAAFATRADVLLLDEPTSGLDPLMEQEFRRCVGEAVARGQTVFLSSHILSEVEQLCARVGILRAGTLVEVATIDRLRAMRSTELDIDIDGRAPRSLSGRRRRQCVAHPHWRPSHVERPARPGAAGDRQPPAHCRQVAGGVARGDLPRVLRRRGPRVSATATVTRLSVRQMRTGAIVLAVACAAMVASTIKAREATESLTPGLVEDLASNPALRALYGTPFDLATPGGFTVWRLGMFLSAAACAWGLLTATRLLRGEEEAGRADLVHTAPITHPSITNITLLVIAAAAPFVGVLVALAFLGTAQEVAGSTLVQRRRSRC